MASTLPWMTASGVRSSWLTSASSRRRCVLVDLEARRHGVERADEIAQLARAAVDLRDAGRVVAGLDPTGRLDERIQRRPNPARKPDPEQDRRPAGDQDDRHRRAGQIRQRARVGDEAQQRADDPQPDDADGDEDERQQEDEAPEPPRHARAAARAVPTRPLRPRGPHHGGPRHSVGGHGSSSGHQCGRSRGRGSSGPAGGHVRAPARRRGSRPRRRSGRSAARAGSARSSGAGS